MSAFTRHLRLTSLSMGTPLWMYPVMGVLSFCLIGFWSGWQ